MTSGTDISTLKMIVNTKTPGTQIKLHLRRQLGLDVGVCCLGIFSRAKLDTSDSSTWRILELDGCDVELASIVLTWDLQDALYPETQREIRYMLAVEQVSQRDLAAWILDVCCLFLLL